jgi:hypothetical protein
MYDIKKQNSVSQFQIYAGMNWKWLLGYASTDFLFGFVLFVVWGDRAPH